MPLQVFRSSAFANACKPLSILGDERRHSPMVGFVRVGRAVNVALEPVHHQPQQSVLNRQAGQRQTACMRYISTPQRSQVILSSAGAMGVRDGAARMGVTGFCGDSDTEALSHKKLRNGEIAKWQKQMPHVAVLHGAMAAVGWFATSQFPDLAGIDISPILDSQSSDFAISPFFNFAIRKGGAPPGDVARQCAWRVKSAEIETG